MQPNIHKNVLATLDSIAEEEKRNDRYLHLTANENQMSQTARRFLGSKLSERYFFGAGDDNFLVDMHPFTALGMASVEELIELAKTAAKDMLHACEINLSCLSGVHAMMCAILSATDPGDMVMTVHHDHGGHFATKGIIDRVGRKHLFASYDLSNLKFDANKIARDFHAAKAKAFYMDVSYYLNPHNLHEVRQALGDEAIIIYDASHTMGLIMGDHFQQPLLEGADVVCANTHKTLPGPQKGMIAFGNVELAKKANAIINDCLFSSPHTHHLIALAVTILEMQAFGKDYAQQVVANSNALGQAMTELGYEVRKANTDRYSENHQVHVFIDQLGDKKDLYHKLIANSISTNFDSPLGNRLFIRLGTQEVTRRGMKESEMRAIAKFIDFSLKGGDVNKLVLELNHSYSKIEYSFD